MLWLSIYGAVSGGGYNSSQGCEPYPLAPCSVDPTDPNDPLLPCHEPKPPPTLQCSAKCSNPAYNISYSADKHGANADFKPTGYSYRDDKQVHAMKYLTENGPLSATFTVMEDFPTYRSGIYKHVTGKALGGHAIMIVGYGTENGTDYWTVKNSWSQYWGDHGYFRIVRGVDEVGIESHMSGWIVQGDEEE
jgi:cathepsin B